MTRARIAAATVTVIAGTIGALILTVIAVATTAAIAIGATP